MKNDTEFDLNQAIQNWRAQLAETPALRPENLDELESHLRDSVVAFQARELSVEEAFAVATLRIGKQDSLKTEFAKVNANRVWLDRLLWMLMGIQVWGLVTSLVGSISSGALSFGLIGGGFNFANHNRAIPVALFTVMRLAGVAASLALCWWLIVRKGNALGSRAEQFLRRRRTLVMFCGALWLLSLVVSGLGYSSTLLLWKFVDMKTAGELTLSTQYANIFAGLVQTVTLLALTLLLARQRLQMKLT